MPGGREFLLGTCVADELVPDLVEALTGRPCDLHLLEVMARGNSFIELVPGHHDRYRYHALFREFLRGRLAFESPGLVGQLHAGGGRVAGGGRAGVRGDPSCRACPGVADGDRALVDRLGFAELLMG